MSKALVVLKSEIIPSKDLNKDLVFIKDRDQLFTLETKLLDRTICEIDNTYLQIIPYVTLIHEETDEIFMYQRGKGSGENRLKYNYSIGLGGHIEDLPTFTIDLVNVVVREAAREIVEETGYPNDLYLIKTLYDAIIDSNFYIFYNPNNDVGSVHLALHFIIKVDKQDIIENEADIITRSSWISKSEIEKQVKNESIVLESWSQIALDLI